MRICLCQLEIFPKESDHSSCSCSIWAWTFLLRSAFLVLLGCLLFFAQLTSYLFHVFAHLACDVLYGQQGSYYHSHLWWSSKNGSMRPMVSNINVQTYSSFKLGHLWWFKKEMLEVVSNITNFKANLSTVNAIPFEYDFVFLNDVNFLVCEILCLNGSFF